jgi:internalin A
MAAGQLGAVIRRFLHVAERAAEDPGDRQLLEHYVSRKDETAFQALVDRHARLVFGVCRSVLHHEQDAEDAFQATFLVLARMAASIHKREAIGSWLHGVALRTALKARRAMHTRRRKEQHADHTRTPEQPVSEAALRELQAILHEEVARLAAKYRAPFVLCCLEGKPRADAAHELGWKEGTVSSRIAQARKVLESRLARRGIALPAALTAATIVPVTASAAVPAAVTIRAAQAFAARRITENVSANAAALAEAVIQAMAIAKLKVLTTVVLALVIAFGGGTLLGYSAWPSNDGEPALVPPVAKAKPEPANGLDKKPADDIAAATIAAYAKLGGSHYDDNVVLHTWALYRERGEKDVPGFHFWSPLEAPLPQVATPFGLDLSNASDKDLKQLAHVKKLRSLCLWKTQVTDAGLQQLAGLKELTWLDLSETAITGSGLKHLAPLKNLTTLYLDVKQLTDANLHTLRDIGLLHAVAHASSKFTSSTHLRELRGLHIPRPRSAAEVTSFRLQESKVSDVGLKALAGFKNLNSLDISHTAVTDAGLKELRSFKKLASLDLSKTSVTGAGLKEFAGLKQLEALNLADTKVTDRELRELTVLKKLTALTLDGNQLTDEGLRALREMNLLHALPFRTWHYRAKSRPRSAPEIVEFDLSEAKISDASLKELADLKNLASLNLRGTKITTAGLKELARFKKLTTLRLDGQQLTDASLRALREVGLLHVLSDTRAGTFLTPGYDERPKSVAEVLALDLRSTQVTDDGLKELAVFKNLKSLEVAHTQLTGRGFRDLVGLKDLTYIGLNESKLTDAGLKEVARLKGLTALDLMDTKLTAEGLKELAGLPKLERLYLSPGQFTDASLRVLRELDLLHKLKQAGGEEAFKGEAYGADPASMAEIFIFDLSGSHVTDSGLKELKALKNLSRVELGESRVTGVGVKDLAGLMKLSQLHLHGSATDAGLKEIGCLKQLDVLHVSGKEVSDAGVKHLAALENLVSFYVGGTNMTDAGLKELTALKNVSFLWLEANQVTDAGMKHVARFDKLRVLYLYEPQVTDAGFMELAALPSLERVILSKTKVTPAGIAALRKALPKCQIN